MARKRKTETEPQPQDQETTAQAGHNSELTEEENRALFFQNKKAYEAALAAKKAADAELKNVCRRAKAECGKDAVADIKDAISFEGEGGREKFNAEIARKQRVARWLGLPVGAEPTFFEMGADRTPDTERAHEAGKAAGMSGETCIPPHDPSVPQHQEWIRGWQAGQAAVMSAFGKVRLPPPAEGAADPDAEEEDGTEGEPDVRPAFLKRNEQTFAS